MPVQPQPPMSQFSGGAPIPGITQNQFGVALGSVDPNTLASNQLAGYIRGNNPIVQDAARQSEALAAARGQGANSSIYGASAAGGAIDALRPLAQFDAGRYGDVDNQNRAALNDYNLQKLQGQNSLTIANVNASTQAAALAEQARQFDIGQTNRTQNREWQLADERTAARANQRSQVFSQLLGTIFSDPSYWRDPQAALGMFNTYSANLDSMLANLFPEYNQQPGDAGAGGQP